jgi:tetratricopeptide (TPR) repeat protein
LDEDAGIAHFASLFDEAKHLSRHDFCSELLNNVQDVRLTHPHNQHWLTYYRGVMSRVVDTFAWDAAHAIDQELYNQSDLPPALRARVTTDLGRYYHLIVGEYDRAIGMFNESLELRRDLNDKPGQAHVLSHMAVAQSAAGDFDAGRASGLACVGLAQQLGAPYRLGWGYYGLGVVESRAGDHSTALDYFRQSLEAFEAAGYEFGAGVVHYHMGRLALKVQNQDAALEHFGNNLQLLQKYEKLVLAARTLVDICEIYLAREDSARLHTYAVEAERLILDQSNYLQMARLRLLQAEVGLRQFLDQQPTSQGDVQERSRLIPPSHEVIAQHYLDALLAGAQAPQAMMPPIVEQIETRLQALIDEGWASLARAIALLVVDGVDQALEGTLARHGQLVVLAVSVCGSLQELELAQRWASLGR